MDVKSFEKIPTGHLRGEELYKLAKTRPDRFDNYANDNVKIIVPLMYKEIEKAAMKGLIKGTVTITFKTKTCNYDFKEIEELIKSKLVAHFEKVYNISIIMNSYVYNTCHKFIYHEYYSSASFVLPEPKQDIYPPKY
jgi:hypothetical protein